MNLDQALRLAVGLRLALEPGCDRIEIAGSVRRGKPEPHDLEIVLIPKRTFVQTGNLFGEMSELELDHFEPALCDLLDGGRWEFDNLIKRNGPRYKRLREVQTGMCCDLFLATLAGWGGVLAIRTGPAGFSQGLVTLALRQGKHVADGYLIHGHPKPEGGCPKGSRCPLILPTLEEADFFQALGLQWCEPRDRRREPMTESEYTPDTLRAAFSDPLRYVLPPGSMTLEPEQVVAGKFADAWQEQVEQMKLDFEKAVDRALDTTPAGRAYLAKHQAQLEAVKAREEALRPHVELLCCLRDECFGAEEHLAWPNPETWEETVSCSDPKLVRDAIRALCRAASGPPATGQQSLGEEGT